MTEKQPRYFKLFRNACRAINSSHDLEKVLELIAKNVVGSLNVKGCVILLLDKATNTLKPTASEGLSKAYLQKGPLDGKRSIRETLQGRSVWIGDATQDPRIQYPEEAKKEGIASVYSVPLCIKGQTIGVLRLYTSEPREFTELEQELISGVADMGGIAIDNARMYALLKNEHDQLVAYVHQWFDYGPSLMS